MSFLSYCKDHFFDFVLSFLCASFFIFFLVAFKVPSIVIWLFLLFFIFLATILILHDFIKRKLFYDTFFNRLEGLDQKYLITELLQKPSFLEGTLLVDALYEIDKSMKEHLNEYREHLDDFKDYLELWIHEVKIPLANLTLMVHNNHSNHDIELLEQLSRLEFYVEQVLYYVRSENSEKDYLIKKSSLKKMINEVIMKNKESFIYQNVAIELSNLDYQVLTDSKWLVFILNQIVNNSLKYHRKENALIKIEAKSSDNVIELCIWDNGIGIPSRDISKVFQKSFTGQNGRKRSTSTGMGLYITKRLCEKLGHRIRIRSKEHEFTEVIISFQKDSYYEVLNDN